MPPASDLAINSRLSSDPQKMETATRRTKILIDQSKRETFGIHSGYRGMTRRLKSQWIVDPNTDEISEGTLAECKVFILAGPRAKLNSQEMEALRGYLKDGGSLLILASEGGEVAADTNINYLLEEYGIMANNDSVIRTIFYKYFDPKEALISNGVLNREIAVASRKSISSDQSANSQTLSFVYPYGCTLNVNKLATAVLSTGSACFPTSRPVAAFHHVQDGKGRLAVCGSSHIFHDSYIDKEENAKIFEVFMEYLVNGLALNKIDSAEPEINDYNPIPDHIHLSEQPKVCLQEGEFDVQIGGDFLRLFDSTISSFDLSTWPAVINAYENLGMKCEQLTLITPNFEVPLPPLQPAVFPPNFKEPPNPQLELFDLDEMFSSQETRLAQLANKCEEEDLEYFIKEASDIVGISLPIDERTPKRILEHLIHQIFEYKKLNQDDENENYPVPQSLFDISAGQQDGDMEEEEHSFSDIDDYDDLQ
ncbi:unnamed protein product, partial [Mesorhabditis spiculigera]